MDYKSIIEQYRGKFKSKTFQERGRVLFNLFSDLQKKGFKKTDLTSDIGDEIAKLLCEDSTIPQTIKQNLDHYIIFMIGRNAELFKEELKKTKPKETEEGIQMDPTEIPEAEWDLDLLKQFGVDDIDE